MKLFVWGCMIVLGLVSCNKSSGGGTVTPPPVADTPVIKGADISWLTQMESQGLKFYNSSGTAMDCMQLMQSLGIDAIRLRVWVNPAGGWNGNADVVAKAKRVKQLGLRLMIDLHYSDTWADPGNQTKPAAWALLDSAALVQQVYDYTFSVLDTLRTAGVVPSWVQVGNETSDGMLWPDGQASKHMAAFAALVSSGYRAVKAINDSIKVIVHINNGYDNALYRWIFDGLKSNGVSWDIIGMSLYPPVDSWQTYDNNCLSNMKDMVTRYNKPVMICEVGMPADQAAVCQSFLSDLISKTRSVPGGNGLGVFYWEPESYNSWQGYKLGAFDDSGKPTAAMNAFSH
ncbi:MAG TPA: glycosyl hydrolase 53 family protein [Puia sp.]|nr:glycosyl hydrolase 53 family protein [Puia sp.]